MEGIIQENMGRPEGEDITPQSVQQGIEMPPELQEAYERVVLAGMKVMFSEQTHKLMLDELQRQGPVAERLGKGIAGLMLMLFKESNGTMPPQVMIPAGMDLLVQAADFINQAKLETVTNQNIGDASEVMIGVLMDKFGVPQGKFMEMVGSFDRDAIEAQAQGGEAPAPEQMMPAPMEQAAPQPPMMGA